MSERLLVVIVVVWHLKHNLVLINFHNVAIVLIVLVNRANLIIHCEPDANPKN